MVEHNNYCLANRIGVDWELEIQASELLMVAKITICALVLLHACSVTTTATPIFNSSANAPTVSAPPIAIPSAPVSSGVVDIGRILADANHYVGQEITIAGVLDAEGQLPRVSFYLRDPNNARLAVSAWAPLEVAKSPTGVSGAKSMAVYVGKNLRLTGILEKNQDTLLLRVSQVVEF
jgi:hypothetical protein